MDRKTFIDLLYKAFEENEMRDLLSAKSANMLCDFADLLIETNKHTNLTAITDIEGIILKHFVDSAAVVRYIPENSSILDVGCGAGFPSVPIAILRDDVRVTALDSTGKKINFVLIAKEKLGLGNLDAICTRAEEYAEIARESFDVCTSRAVARLNILSELCVPFVKIDGLFIAMKSEKGTDEASEAESGIKKLGAIPVETFLCRLSLGDTEIDREIRVYKKASRTPAQYPRKYAQIVKKPL